MEWESMLKVTVRFHSIFHRLKASAWNHITAWSLENFIMNFHSSSFSSFCASCIPRFLLRIQSSRFGAHSFGAHRWWDQRRPTRNLTKSLRVHLEFLYELFLNWFIYCTHREATPKTPRKRREISTSLSIGAASSLKMLLAHTFSSSSLVGMFEIGKDTRT